MKRVIFSSNITQNLRQHINTINYLSIKYYSKGLDFEDAIPSGAFSVYFRKGSIGIKVLRTCFKGSGLGGYKSPKRVVLSLAWQDAIEEFAALRIAEKTGYTPIPYCVKIVRSGQKYYPAIFMEHIRGIPLGDFCYEMNEKDEMPIYRGMRNVEKLFQRKCGIDHSLDAGGNNIIVVKYRGNKVQQIKLIDFSPSMIEISSRTLEKNLTSIPELWNRNVFGWKYTPIRGMEFLGSHTANCCLSNG